MGITSSILKLVTSGVDLTSQILARTSPKELKELMALEKKRLSIEGDIADYKRLKPSDRIQSKLESYLSDLEKTCDKIIVIQKFAETKIDLMLAAANTDK